MRSALLLGLVVSLGACGDPYQPGPFPYPDAGGGGPFPGAPCTTSGDCIGGDVCARDHECLAPGDARSVMVRWTIGGAAANATSCAPIVSTGQLQIMYEVLATGETTGFAPLMCGEGQFYVDVWPARYDYAQVSVTSVQTGHGYSGSNTLASSGNQDVTVDLQPN
jgi:hypothetical protein